MDRRGPKRKSIDELRDRDLRVRVNERDLALLNAVQVMRGGERSKGETLRAILREEHERLEAEDRARQGQPPPRKRFEHGTFSGYNYHACRCFDCKQAWNAYQRDYQQRRKRERSVQVDVAESLPGED